MATYRFVVYSILEAIKESKDDSDLKRNTVIFWTQVITNRLIQQRLSKRKINSGEFLSHIGQIQVNIDGIRKYALMPSPIIDLENDNGIEQVTYYLEDFEYCDQPMTIPFEKTSPAKVWSLYAIPVRKPTPSKPKMAREGSNLYLYGIENVNVQYIDMWLYTAINPQHLIDLDTDIPLAEDQIEVLINKVMGMARFAMLLPNDKTNIGGDLNPSLDKKTALANAPISYSDQQQQSQNQEE